MIGETFHLYDKHTNTVGDRFHVNLMHLSVMQESAYGKNPFMTLFFTNGIRFEAVHEKGNAYALSRWQEFLRG